MNHFIKFRNKKSEILWTFICVCILIGFAVVMFLYNRYVIYVKNMEAAHINLTNHLNYTYKDKFYGNMDIDYDVKTNTYGANVDFYIPNEEYDFNLSSRGHVIGDGYLHNNKDNLISHRFARQLKESLVSDFKEKFPEIFNVYVEMQILKGKYNHTEFYSKEVNEPHVVNIYLTSVNLYSNSKFNKKVDEIGRFLVKTGYENLNNVYVHYVIRKEAPPYHTAFIDFAKYAKEDNNLSS